MRSKSWGVFVLLCYAAASSQCHAFSLFKSAAREVSVNGRITMQPKVDSDPADSFIEQREKIHYHGSRQIDNIQMTLRNTCISLALSCTLFFSPTIPDLHQSTSSPISSTSFFHPPIASAADYGSLSDDQKLVAEAWRIVDNNFIDRTFNNQDWFQLRQDAVKKKYKSNQEALDAIDKIVASLGDKYTRYLPPAKYKSLVDSATGTLAGAGIELSLDKESGKVYASDIEPSSPAFEGKSIPKS